jgi:hypothetical protein
MSLNTRTPLLWRLWFVGITETSIFARQVASHNSRAPVHL